MALKAKSLFLFGFQVTEFNRSLDFVATSGGPEIQATLTIGYYSLSSLMAEIKKQMQAADPSHVYTVTANRAYNGGTENRVTISTNGTALQLLFGTGTRIASSCASLLGFTTTNKTGSTSYTGTLTAGTAVVPEYVGYNFIPPELMRKNFGSVNVSASGMKEAIVWNVQKFWQVQFKYIPKASAISNWSPLMTWLMLQRSIEFTPEISTPSVFYQGTIESTEGESTGLGFTIKEMLPNFPDYYDSGIMKFRVKE